MPGILSVVRRGLIIVATCLSCAGCGSLASVHTGRDATTPDRRLAASAGGALPQAHPQVVEPVAGAGGGSGAATAPSSVSVGGGGSSSLAQPISLVQVKRELAASGMSADTDRATLTPQGLAIAPANAPAAVQEVIDAGNEIAHLPYRFGGGHGTFIDTAYDCSGSLSFAFAAAGLLGTTMTSGQLEHWGDPGPGKWITVFADAGHTFAYIAGLRFDTVALAQTGSRWSNRAADEPDLSSFVVRHPPGL